MAISLLGLIRLRDRHTLLRKVRDDKILEHGLLAMGCSKLPGYLILDTNHNKEFLRDLCGPLRTLRPASRNLVIAKERSDCGNLFVVVISAARSPHLAAQGSR